RWERDALEDRLTRALHGGPPDPGRLAARLIMRFDADQPPPAAQVCDFLQDEPLLVAAWGQTDVAIVEQSLILDPLEMGSSPREFPIFPVPNLATWREVREWLGLRNNELAWFADREGRQCKSTEAKLHHYRYKWVAKKSGAFRLLENPKPRLKHIQKQILREILDRVPPHASAHGFRRNRSTLTYVKPHIGKQTLLRMDLKDFFHRIPPNQIGALFRRLGYPHEISRLLQGLCTHASAPQLAGAPFRKLPWETQRRLQAKHLPQGAPTSPAIANLCAWRLDCRLCGLADRFGLDYTRYADDLAFSGPARLARLAPHLQAIVGAIALDEGFNINQRKTRLNRASQSQRLAGIVINEKPNIPRRDYDRLKAILHNCARFGVEDQNRGRIENFREHLAGRVSHANWLNPGKGERLFATWSDIEWPE
ncbi:MAG: reverse transcriptase family protein, partial [Pseudomonadota bacterium]